MRMMRMMRTMRSYSHGPFGDATHEVWMHLRLIPEFGGDGTFCGVLVLNDTGSTILTVFTSDFQHLGNTQGYGGWMEESLVTDANGAATVLPQLLVQVQLVDNHGEPWGDWIVEQAIVRTPTEAVERLSGRNFRNVFYIGTGPGNHVLAVSASKGGLTSLL
ncbi:hypothetical protein GJ744_003238 [Endocarpon pusillum]|uniref:Uncharacterized protein n=1 Tax=Endocarpon pusillum TaxID=364733 RepID=A0A8H7E0S0_9EURO|nr:hypothetical protein GJ744_003238 [Endocarpon pusillum]